LKLFYPQVGRTVIRGKPIDGTGSQPRSLTEFKLNGLAVDEAIQQGPGVFSSLPERWDSDAEDIESEPQDFTKSLQNYHLFYYLLLLICTFSYKYLQISLDKLSSVC